MKHPYLTLLRQNVCIRLHNDELHAGFVHAVGIDMLLMGDKIIHCKDISIVYDSTLSSEERRENINYH